MGVSFKTHELKTVNPHFQAIADGDKWFELRYDDRGFKVGDILWLREYDADTRVYSGRELKRRVTYILRSHPGLVDGFVVLGIAEV